MPKWVEIEDAKRMGGLRLVLTADIGGPPWTEAAKAVFHVKKIPYAPVAQRPMATNQALLDWTGHENAPIAVYENEKARAGWTEILHLAERLAPEPSLIPPDEEDRIRFFGLANEICGEDGFAWNKRHLMVKDALDPKGRTGVPREIAVYLGERYGYAEAAAARAPGRMRDVLGALSEQLRTQRASGKRFLVGDALSALDLYWASFAALVAPLPQEVCPMPDWLRAAYTIEDREILSAMDPGLLRHRDEIYRDFLVLPMDC
jgi:glutathione S-transferase